MSLTARKVTQKRKFSPLLPGVLHAHYPNFYRDPFGSGSVEEASQNCLHYIEEYLFKMVCPPDEVAAFVVEPIQGEGGYVVPPASFLLGLQALAKRHGILIIADEVQSGIGRTGKMWASQLFDGFVPDIITSAKGLASGLPLGAVIAQEGIMTWEPGAHASTFGGNPVSCVAALKTLELVEGGLMENARQVGAYLKEKLVAMQAEFPVLGEVRGEGLMIGVEIVKDAESRERNAALRDRIVDDCFFKGLLILGCGENSIRFSPPLVVTKAQTDAALEIFRAVLVASHQ